MAVGRARPVISLAVSWTFAEMGGLPGVVSCFRVCPSGRPGGTFKGAPPRCANHAGVAENPSTGYATPVVDNVLASYALTTWNWRPGAYGVPPGV